MKIYVDESGDPGVCAKQNDLFSIGFAAVKDDDDVIACECRFKQRIAKIDGGNHFVHVGNLIRNEKPYDVILPENRRKLFWSLFFFTINSPIRISSIHCRKDGILSRSQIPILEARLRKELQIWISERYSYLESFDQIIFMYDLGQPIVKSVIENAFLEAGIPIRFEIRSQGDEVLLQVADLACLFDLLKYKHKEGSFTHSEQEFFGLAGKIKKDFLKPLEKKTF